jgi:CO/xanthine dehydrogenase Mo-binding subunit
VGQPIRRVEEDRLVRGKGIFVDDQKLTGMLHIRFVRSSYGHAKITRVDVTKAAALPGVVCTLTGAEVKGLVNPFIEIGPDVRWPWTRWCTKASRWQLLWLKRA